MKNKLDCFADDVLVRMLDERTASDNKQLLAHSGAIYSTSFSPDRSQMVSCSEDGTGQSRIMFLTSLHEQTSNHNSFCPLFTVRLWSLLTWSNLVCYKGHVFPVWDCKFG